MAVFWVSWFIFGFIGGLIVMAEINYDIYKEIFITLGDLCAALIISMAGYITFVVSILVLIIYMINRKVNIDFDKRIWKYKKGD